MKSLNSWMRALLAVSALLLVSACAPSKYIVEQPTPSNMRYEMDTANEKIFAVVDARREGDRIFNTGTLTATLQYNGAPLDATAFLATNLQRELASRGLPVTVKVGPTAGGDVLNMNVFRMQNHRSNGFAPYVTFTMASLDIEDATGTHRVSTFVKRGKVPVWSFSEVIEPTMNQPLSIAVKELASKISNHVYGFQTPDSEVERLVARLNGERTDKSYLDVYALGFTNNPKAIPVLVELTKEGDEYIRLAAISSLGNLRAVGQFGYLRSLYETNDGLWQDRAMALKAIGDLGTNASRAYLEKELAKWRAQDPPTKESTWTAQVIDLYL